MNEKLQAVIRYLCQFYAYQTELSNARVTKMVYLADWEFARNFGRQITGIHWHFDHFGPYVPDVMQAAIADPNMRVEQTVNMYGSPKTLLGYAGPAGAEHGLTEDEQTVLDFVMEQTSGLTFQPFIRHVYNTYPIRRADRYAFLDLVDLAEAENQEAMQVDRPAY